MQVEEDAEHVKVTLQQAGLNAHKEVTGVGLGRSLGITIDAEMKIGHVVQEKMKEALLASEYAIQASYIYA